MHCKKCEFQWIAAIINRPVIFFFIVFVLSVDTSGPTQSTSYSLHHKLPLPDISPKIEKKNTDIGVFAPSNSSFPLKTCPFYFLHLKNPPLPPLVVLKAIVWRWRANPCTCQPSAWPTLPPAERCSSPGPEPPPPSSAWPRCAPGSAPPRSSGSSASLRGFRARVCPRSCKGWSGSTCREAGGRPAWCVPLDKPWKAGLDRVTEGSCTVMRVFWTYPPCLWRCWWHWWFWPWGWWRSCHSCPSSHIVPSPETAHTAVECWATDTYTHGWPVLWGCW